jgi:GNAT superfamily N-acetyltransferase
MLRELEIRSVGPTDPAATDLVAAMIREADEVYADRPLPPAPPLTELVMPGDRVLVAYDGAEPVACGVARLLEPGIAEIKRMFVAPPRRGEGIGRRLLAELERHARELGCERVRLDTADRQTAALGLYRASGYLEIDDYSGNRGASHWFEKALC